jgi:prevent-host-death family protein
MVKFNCVDCGVEWESKVKKPWARRCPSCAEKVRAEGEGPIQQRRKGYGVGRDEVGVRELKANPTELLRLLEETPDMEIIITRYGKPSAKLVSLTGKPAEVPWPDRVSLRGTWSHLPEPTDEDFAEAKRIWEPQSDV